MTLKLTNGLLPDMNNDSDLAKEINRQIKKYPLNSSDEINQSSSRAFIANAFGYFIKESRTPKLPVQAFGSEIAGPARSVGLRADCNLPWKGGRNQRCYRSKGRGGRAPNMDVLIQTPEFLLGIKMPHFEKHVKSPISIGSEKTKFRDPYQEAEKFNDWGDQMTGFDELRHLWPTNDCPFEKLDAARLVKHGYALRTAVYPHANQSFNAIGKIPVLIYLYPESAWQRCNKITPEILAKHRDEIGEFQSKVKDDEVTFIPLSFDDLLEGWKQSADTEVLTHVENLKSAFSYLLK